MGLSRTIGEGGPHASAFNWHDPPPGLECIYRKPWFYVPLANVVFLNGHNAFILLGPHGSGDMNVNTETYILPNEGPDLAHPQGRALSR